MSETPERAVPNFPRGRVQPHKPAPYARPSVSLGEPTRRSWTSVPITEVKAGDILPDVGRVERVDEDIRGDDPLLTPGVEYAPRWTITVTGVGGTRTFGGHEVVFAFTDPDAVM